MTNCHPIVEEIAASVTNPEMLPIAFATSALRGLRRTLEDITGAVDNGGTWTDWKRSAPCRKKYAHESGQTSYDESTALPLDPKMVVDAIKGRVDVHA